jgi:uncharacterized protein
VRSRSPFIVPLRDIPAEGHRVALDLEATWVGQALADLELPWAPSGAPLRLESDLFRVQHDVVGRGRLAGTLTVPCSRCAETATFALATPFDVTFVPGAGPSRSRAGARADHQDGGEKAGEVEMHPDDAELATYRDEEVDLEDPVRQHLLLALPYAPLCKPDCLGLCASCGRDLNSGPCSCAPAEELPTSGKDPWAKLRNVKL